MQMQQVTIKPRSFFKHVITVEQAGKELHWSFDTKKNSIAFGLSYKPLPRRESLVALESRPAYKHTIATGVSSQDISASSPTGSVNSVDSQSYGLKTSVTEMRGLSSYSEVIQLAHYDSSKKTIRGSYVVKHPGVYVMLFDNTFSVKTSKKLVFSAGVSDADPKRLEEVQVQGWLLKKGNRRVQGYSRRWVKIDGAGNFYYYRNPESRTHGVVNLKNCALVFDHNKRLIDIDSGKKIYHFKIEQADDFQRWIDAMQQFASSNNNSFSYSADGVGIDSDLNRTHDELLLQLECIKTLTTDISRLLPDANSSASKTTSRDNLTKQLHEQVEKIIAQNSLAKITTISLKEAHSRQVEKCQQFESAFYACFHHSNTVKEKFGLEPSELPAFIYDKAPTESSSVYHDAQYDLENEGNASETNEMSSEESLQFTEQSTTEMSNIAFQETAKPEQESAIIHKPRTELPVAAANMENLSMMGILRNNIGKDLSTITMPIILNEPINLLQKLCEELEYAELLTKAAVTTSPVERMCFVAAFVVSGYASTVHRAIRKPFNPLLGETYELTSPKGFKFIAEKVSQQPPIMACHAESSDFILFQDSLIKPKFWG